MSLVGKSEVNTVSVYKEDIGKHIYFIAEMSQNTSEKGMYGTLAGKGDLMGGIFDRWINLIPESVVFNKCILPKVSNGKKVEVVTDFYKYKPKQDTTGIAPDVLGIKVNDKVIPFVIFDEGWKPVKNKPQIEVKTFKKSQQMVSLRNQGYEGKYLIMVESDYRVDYLLPFFDSKLFSNNVYNQMIMDDDVFIKSDSENQITKLHKVTTEKSSLGTLSLLVVTLAKDFIKCATLCKENESPLRISSIEKYVGNKIKPLISKKLKDCCNKQNWGKNIYCWNNIFGYEEKIKYLDFYCNDVEHIEIIKINKKAIYIKALRNCIFNDTKLEKDCLYYICFEPLSRENSQNQEYFLQKDLVKYLPNNEKDLLKNFSKIISEV